MELLMIDLARAIYYRLSKTAEFFDLRGIRSGDFLLAVARFLTTLITPQGVLSCPSPVLGIAGSLRFGEGMAVAVKEPLRIEPCLRNPALSGWKSMGKYHLCNAIGGQR